MTKELVEQIDNEMIAALGAVAERHNLTVEIPSGSYSDHDFKPKVVFRITNPTLWRTTNFGQVRVDAEHALSTVAQQHSLTAEMLSARYDSWLCTFKFVFKDDQADQVAFTNAVHRFPSEFPITVSDYGRTFIHDGDECTVIGLNWRKLKKPVVVRDRKGDQYYVAAALVRRLIDGGKDGARESATEYVTR